MNKPAFPHLSMARPNRQRGVSLMMALMALVAISLAAIALVRAVDTATLISGNLAFRQSSVNVADSGVDAAVQWITSNPSSLSTDSVGNGYYATGYVGTDITGKATPGDLTDDVDWNLDTAEITTKPHVMTTDATTGSKRAYIITRLCDSQKPLNDPTNHCLSYQGASPSGSSKVNQGYGEGSFTTRAQAYYQITTRVVGPRNTVSYVQAIVLM